MSVDADDAWLDHLLAREGQQLSGQSDRASSRSYDLVEVLVLFDRQLLLGEAGEAEDHGEDVVEVMGHAAGEATHRVHLLGLEELALEVLALGDVDDRANHAARDASFVAGHLTLEVDVAEPAAGGDNVEVEPIVELGSQGGGGAFCDQGALIGSDEGEELRMRGAELGAGYTEQGVDVVGPDEPVAGQVPLPEAEAANPEHGALASLPLAELVERAALRDEAGDVGSQRVEEIMILGELRGAGLARFAIVKGEPTGWAVGAGRVDPRRELMALSGEAAAAREYAGD